jgi:hypothetical protein
MGFGADILFKLVSYENHSLPESQLGVVTLLLPKTINAAAPGGAPPRRISKVRKRILSFLV